MARASQRYIAVIADMVRSRELPRSRRRDLQKHFSGLIATLNRDYRKAIAARFIITLGDEFQGILCLPATAGASDATEPRRPSVAL